MANAIKPMFVVAYSDGKRYKTNVFLLVPMANVIKPQFFVCSDGKHYKTFFFV